MRLDSARFVIRPRGILESLDLAFLFCGRHWWGLLIATALGVGPLMLMNTLVSFNTDEGNLIVLLLMLAQAPWATVWITLYLGQITFSERFSLGLAWRMFWRGWLQLFCFQGIIRTLCMVIWILAPVSYVSLYYMNQIILLEQTPLSRTWARRTALNKRNLGSILSLIAVELIVFAIGVFVLTQILNAISSLWRDHFSLSAYYQDTEQQAWGWLQLHQWEVQLAWWISLSFITVWRYTTYLDCRVRREGWDVELGMRSQAQTYQSWETN